MQPSCGDTVEPEGMRARNSLRISRCKSVVPRVGQKNPGPAAAPPWTTTRARMQGATGATRRAFDDGRTVARSVAADSEVRDGEWDGGGTSRH